MDRSQLSQLSDQQLDQLEKHLLQQKQLLMQDQQGQQAQPPQQGILPRFGQALSATLAKAPSVILEGKMPTTTNTLAEKMYLENYKAGLKAKPIADEQVPEGYVSYGGRLYKTPVSPEEKPKTLKEQAIEAAQSGKPLEGLTIEETKKLGGILIPVAPGTTEKGLTAETAGKLAMIGQGESDLNEAEGLLFPNGKFDPKMAFATNFPGGGFPYSGGREVFSKVLNAVNAKLRVETGAQANPSEVKNILQRFMPTTRDSDATAKDKYRRLKEFMSNTRAIIDPTGKYKYTTQEQTQQDNDPLGIR